MGFFQLEYVSRFFCILNHTTCVSNGEILVHDDVIYSFSKIYKHVLAKVG